MFDVEIRIQCVCKKVLDIFIRYKLLICQIFNRDILSRAVNILQEFTGYTR